MDHQDILAWLREDDPARLEVLWRRADAVRRAHVGDAVHLRGLVEVSNHCVRACWYCGLRSARRTLRRYRLRTAEILEAAHQAVRFGYGTLVLQAGEDYGLTREWMADVIRRIKDQTPLAVTLSLGERPEEDLEAWRQAGADRYLLRFETSDRRLYERIHPPLAGRRSDRVALLGRLRQMGYEIGSGVMVGLPGQTFQTLARDIELWAELDLDMIGLGPYLPHPDTPLGRGAGALAAAPDQQVPNSEVMTYKVLALARLVCPLANIPSTTALATLNPTSGRATGLTRGANVVMPNLTPMTYRAAYEIYPAKACLAEPPEAFHERLLEQLRQLGRPVGRGPGSSVRRQTAPPLAVCL